MRKFNDAFEPYGLSKTAIKPCYGMAEATLFVSATKRENEAKVVHVDREELNAGRFAFVDADAPGAVTQVSCGQVARDQWATIVDADTATELPDAQIGEIWLHGANIGAGYWVRTTRPAKPSTTAWSPGSPRAAMPTASPTTPSGCVPVTTAWGRRRAVHHRPCQGPGDRRRPQPLPAGPGVHRAGNQYRAASGVVSAFAVPVNQLPTEVFEFAASGLTYDPDDASEQLVIVAERGPGKRTDPQDVADTVRAAVASRHGVMVRDVLLVPAGSIPRTSSGKIARRASRAAYIDGTLRGGYQQTAFPDALE